MRVGAALAEARGRAGLTVAEVSQRTRIREAVITGIEHDDYSACGGDFYARGNIRGIAKAVGADPEPLICEYDASHRAADVTSSSRLTADSTPAARWLASYSQISGSGSVPTALAMPRIFPRA